MFQKTCSISNGWCNGSGYFYKDMNLRIIAKSIKNSSGMIFEILENRIKVSLFGGG